MAQTTATPGRGLFDRLPPGLRARLLRLQTGLLDTYADVRGSIIRNGWPSSFRAPRQFNWVVGILLLVFTYLLSFTGYLLPWDQLAIWAITVGTNMIGSTPPPQLGALIKFLLVGDYSVSQNALIRFYTLHVI